jgi:hypothetical protein
MEALHKDGEDEDHHKIGGMMVEYMVVPWQWRPLQFQRPCYSQFDMIIYVPVIFTFLPYYFVCALHVVDICHDRIAFLRKDEILIPFTNSCNYRVLIIVD